MTTGLFDPTNSNVSLGGPTPQSHAANAVCLRLAPPEKRVWRYHRRTAL
jgi:hypothetical protein